MIWPLLYNLYFLAVPYKQFQKKKRNFHRCQIIKPLRASSIVKENNFLRPSILTLNITKQPSKVSDHLKTVSLLILLKKEKKMKDYFKKAT